jgi:hypothetical protein
VLGVVDDDVSDDIVLVTLDDKFPRVFSNELVVSFAFDENQLVQLDVDVG